MFDFLRNLKDTVAAEVTLAGGCNCTHSETPLIIKLNSDDSDYLKAIGYSHGSVYPTMMKKIVDNNLQYTDPKTIAEKLKLPLYTPDRINDILEAYSIMNFLKEKEYSAEEAGDIMKVANIYDSNREKPISEIALLADCSEDSINSVAKLLSEYKNRMQVKPFSVQNDNAPKNESNTKQTNSKTSNKKAASATA